MTPAVSKRGLLLAAAAIATTGPRYGLGYGFGYVGGTAVVFGVLMAVRVVWRVVVEPLGRTALRGLPQPENAHFLWGHMGRIFKEPTGEPQRDWIDTVPNDGLIYYRWLFNEPRVLVADPKALAEVLVQRSYEFVKPEQLRKGIGRLLGIGVLLAEGDEHKRQRKLLMPAFSFRHVKDLYPIFWKKSVEMTDQIGVAIKNSADGSPVVDLSEWASRATLDIIGLAGMGKDFDSLANPDNPLNKAYHQMFASHRSSRLAQLLLGIIPLWLAVLLPIKRNTDMHNAIATIQNVARHLIHDKRAALANETTQNIDILSVAMQSGGFTDQDLVNQLMTFLAAGHETTASALTWAVYCLCRHPSVQTRLREELHAELPALQSRDADAISSIPPAALDKLTYLNAVVQETLRLFPPVALTYRQTTRATTIQSHPIPAHTTIVICPWALNTSTHLWGPDARHFQPARWLRPGTAHSGGGAASNYALSTFLHGPRSCIGRDFARAEFACLLACLVARWEMGFEEGEGYALRIQGGITARPKGGLRVRLREV